MGGDGFLGLGTPDGKQYADVSDAISAVKQNQTPPPKIDTSKAEEDAAARARQARGAAETIFSNQRSIRASSAGGSGGLLTSGGTQSSRMLLGS